MDNLPVETTEKEDAYFHTIENGELVKIELKTGRVVGKVPNYEEGLIKGQHFDPVYIAGQGNYGKKYHYNDAYKDLIVHHLAEGETLSSIGKKDGFPSITLIYQWMEEYPEFKVAVAAGKKARAEGFVDDIIDSVAVEKDLMKDDVPAAKLKYDKLKQLAKWGNPEEYSEKVKHSGDGSNPIHMVVNTGISKEAELPHPNQQVIDITPEGEQ